MSGVSSSTLIPIVRELLAELRHLRHDQGITNALNSLNSRVAALDGRIQGMAVDLSALIAAQNKVVAAITRASAELRDLATKVTNTVDPAQLATIGSTLSSTADGLDAVVDEVDTDGSSPRV